MFDNVINMVLASLIAISLCYYSDVPVEEALTVGFVAVIAYVLSDISRHLRKATQ